MRIQQKYKTRAVRFLEVYPLGDWRIKVYTITIKDAFVDLKTIKLVKSKLPEWLQQKENYGLETYGIATLIIHKGKEGCFAIINWWIDENMLQNHVYLASNETPDDFAVYSDKGIMTCVWEMAVLWYERNLWVKYVLKKHKQPDVESYLNKHLNADV